MLHTLVYLSSSKFDLSEHDLQNILAKSRRNNKELDVTGVLLYGRGSFIQVLEGSRPAIEYLIEKIDKDNRHANIIKILSSKIEKRNFPNWSMGFKRLSDESSEENLLSKNFAFSDAHFSTVLTQDQEVTTLLKTFKKYNYN